MLDQGNELPDDPDIVNQRQRWGKPIAHFDLKPGNSKLNTVLSDAKLLGRFDLIISSFGGRKGCRRPQGNGGFQASRLW